MDITSLRALRDWVTEAGSLGEMDCCYTSWMSEAPGASTTPMWRR